MATVNVVKGSADEAILRAQYGDAVKFNYTNANQFAGADRFETNKMYQGLLGNPINNAGDLNNYNGVKLQTGGSLSDSQIKANQAANQAAYTQAQAANQIAQQTKAKQDTQTQMEQLKKAQLKASMAGLDKQRTNSLSNLQAERAVIEPQYQKQKIAANVTAKQTARSFDEYMAQRGGNNSGIAGQGTLLNNMAYQGQVGSLNEAEAGAISDNARRVTGVNNAYESDKVGARAGIEAQGLQAYINQMNQDRTFGLQQQQMNNQVDQFGQSLGLQREQVDYGKSRDLVGDSRYADETQYNRSQAEMEWEFKRQGYSDDQAYRMATLAIDQQNANTSAYKSSSAPKSSKGADGGKYNDTSTSSLKDKMDAALASGARVDELLYELDDMEEDGSAYLKNTDMQYLRDYLESKRQTMTDLRRSQGGGI